MSWYLFNNSPERQYRGIKVEGYQNMHKTKVNLDWGLGQLSPKKQSQSVTRNIPIATRNTKSQHQTSEIIKSKKQKSKIIEQAVKILTQSSDDQQKQQLIRVLKKYQHKHQKQPNNQKTYKYQKQPYSKTQQNNQYLDRKNYQQTYAMPSNKNYVNKSMNVLNTFDFDSNKNNTKNKPNIDLQTAKRMRFLQNSLLPEHKRDNMSAILDFQLNQKIADSMSDSRISGKSHFGNKKNQSLVQLGDGYNSFVPMRQKIKDMNQKLKQMYDYDQWCKKRQLSQIKLG